MAREHCDSYLYYIRYKTLGITSSQTPFQVILNPVVFRTYIQKLIEFNENQGTPLYRPPHLEYLKHKSEKFEVPDLETRIQRHDNPLYWPQQDILQIKNFQYRFFNNITLTNDTIPQVKVFTQFF